MKFSRIIKGSVLAGGALLIAKGLDDRLETTRFNITSDKIPAGFSGFKIVHISDLHASTVPGLYDEIRGEAPDIIVITGDLAHDRGTYLPVVHILTRLREIAPIYYVSGNHDVRRPDYSEYCEALKNTGAVSLDDISILWERGGDTITLSGIADPFSEVNPTITRNIKASMERLPETNNYHICLFHRANHMDILLEKNFDLILSGHMHGGQFRFPNGRGVCAPKSSWGSGGRMLFPKYFAGHYKKGNTDMIVNRGLGNPMVIPRLFNRPEITVITLN